MPATANMAIIGIPNAWPSTPTNRQQSFAPGPEAVRGYPQ